MIRRVCLGDVLYALSVEQAVLVAKRGTVQRLQVFLAKDNSQGYVTLRSVAGQVLVVEDKNCVNDMLQNPDPAAPCIEDDAPENLAPGIEEDVPEKWAVAHRYLDLHKDEGLPWPSDVAQTTQVDGLV